MSRQLACNVFFLQDPLQKHSTAEIKISKSGWTSKRKSMIGYCQMILLTLLTKMSSTICVNTIILKLCNLSAHLPSRKQTGLQLVPKAISLSWVTLILGNGPNPTVFPQCGLHPDGLPSYCLSCSQSPYSETRGLQICLYSGFSSYPCHLSYDLLIFKAMCGQ
jgi:hypothetical protein